MDFLAIGPLVKVGLVFFGLVLLLRVGVQIGLALTLGGLGIGFSFGMDPLGMARTMIHSVGEIRALGLLCAISLIHLMSSLMERAGLSQGLIDALKGRGRSPSWKMVILPALVGLLPMPGGAYFSAPMLDGFDLRRNVSPALKSVLNYWFRHIWEYWWPLFPAVLLTCKIANIEVWKFSLAGFPMTWVAMGAGLPLLARLPKALDHPVGSQPGQKKGSLWQPLLPMMVAIIPGVFLSPLVALATGSSILAQASREASLSLGLLLAILIIWASRLRGMRAFRPVLFDGRLPRMWVTIAGVLCFKAVMEESGAAAQLSLELSRLHVPKEMIAIVLPLTIGILSGLPIAFVGTCLPVVLSMERGSGVEGMAIPWIVLTFVSGFVGTLLAPTHLCLVLSNEYFGTSYREVCRFLLLPCMLLMAGGIGYFAILRAMAH
jgi:integral membrane protein (TIGR00529 family)